MNKLTVLIPTYNRKDYLKELLTNLSEQGHYGEYSIIISDNHSNYDVLNMIKESYNSEFVKMISCHSWNYNVGMMTNISIPFSFVKTDWCLFLSDDDRISSNTLDIVLRDVNREENQDLTAIKYSLAKYGDGKFIHDDMIVKTVADLSSYYLQFQPGRDDRIYLSMLYNLRLLQPYLIKLTQYSYSGVSFWLPIITAISEEKGYFKFSSEGLYDYNINTNEGWYSNSKRYLDTLLGIRTCFDSFHSMDYKTYKLFRKMILLENFRCKTIAYSILNISGFRNRYLYYRLLKNYMQGNILQQIIYRSIIWFGLIFNISPNMIKSIVGITHK